MGAILAAVLGSAMVTALLAAIAILHPRPESQERLSRLTFIVSLVHAVLVGLLLALRSM